MIDYKRHDAVDMSILGRITENEVELWMAAKLQSIRESGTKINSMSIATTPRDWAPSPHIDTQWCLHAADKCDMGTSIDVTLSRLIEQVKNNPHKRAIEARQKAARLIKTAEAIESFTDDSANT